MPEADKFANLIIVGDRVLIRPRKESDRTRSGLFLPPGVQENEQIRQGWVIKTGPGYALPIPGSDEPWKNPDEKIQYVPLQAKPGDMAIFLLRGAIEVEYKEEKFFVVPQQNILMLERDEGLFD